jgi:hypothetical protein
MSSKAQVHIAGVGISSGGSEDKASVNILVSALTKALLDAGVTYDDVGYGVRTHSLDGGAKAFEAFGDDGVRVNEANDSSELQDAAKLVTEKGAQCVLVLAADKVSALRLLQRTRLTGPEG